MGIDRDIYLKFWGGVKLSPFVHGPQAGPLYEPQMIEDRMEDTLRADK
jgi:hypothetical protein